MAFGARALQGTILLTVCPCVRRTRSNMCLCVAIITLMEWCCVWHVGISSGRGSLFNALCNKTYQFYHKYSLLITSTALCFREKLHRCTQFSAKQNFIVQLICTQKRTSEKCHFEFEAERAQVRKPCGAKITSPSALASIYIYRAVHTHILIILCLYHAIRIVDLMLQ